MDALREACHVAGAALAGQRLDAALAAETLPEGPVVLREEGPDGGREEWHYSWRCCGIFW